MPWSPCDGTGTGQLCKQVCSDYDMKVLAHGRHVNRHAGTAVWLFWQMAWVETGMPMVPHGGTGTQVTCEEAAYVVAMSHGTIVKRHSLAATWQYWYIAGIQTGMPLMPLGLYWAMVYVQTCGPKVPHDGPGPWQTYKHAWPWCWNTSGV